MAAQIASNSNSFLHYQRGKNFGHTRRDMVHFGLDNNYRRTLATSDLIVTPSDTVIGCFPAAPLTVTLPPLSSIRGGYKFFVIKDEGGTAGANNITITPTSPDLVDGAATLDISDNYGSIIMYSSGKGGDWNSAGGGGSGGGGSGGFSAIRPNDWISPEPITLADAINRLAYGYFLAHQQVPAMPHSAYATDLESGSTHYGTITSAVSTSLLGATASTVSMWVKRESAGAEMFLMDLIRTGTDAKFHMRFTAANLIRVEGISDGVDATGIGVSSASAYAAIGIWYHVVGIFDCTADTASIYVNNVLDVTAAAVTNSATFDATVGASFLFASPTPDRSFDGAVDEMSIWDKRLSVAEVNELWNGGVPADVTLHSAYGASVISYWRMGDGDTVPTVTDQNATTDITLVNSPTFELDAP